ncbi:MAG: hypothetical protein QG565_937, partial [Campylobacterota bacterium]|nr:hypothetical protein [Campylobacterota bacterium]
YVGWDEKQKVEMISTCKNDNNASLCECVDEKIFKEYSFESYKGLDKNSSDFREFIKDTKEECADDSWF